jgi:NAD+ synthase
MIFSRDILKLDCQETAYEIQNFIKNEVFNKFKKKGAIIGLSGGIDSALSAALCVKALGAENVIGLILPEKETNPCSIDYAKLHAKQLGIKTFHIDITSILISFDVYSKKNEIIMKIFPEFKEDMRYRLILPQNLLDRDRFNIYSLEIEIKPGEIISTHLNIKDYRELVALTNIKQRTRMVQLYYFAEKNNYIVVGTTNKTEYLQGFFVKYGDGGVDIEPLADLYKTQVFELAEYLNVPEVIIQRKPSPDTYSLEVSDTEFYYCIPFDKLDLLLYAYESHIDRLKIKQELILDESQIERAFVDFERKRKMTEHLRHLPPVPSTATF